MNATEEMQIVDSHDKVDAAVERVASVREAVGPHFGIGVDFHGRVHRPMAEGAGEGARAVPADVHRGAGAVRERARR